MLNCYVLYLVEQLYAYRVFFIEIEKTTIEFM